MARLVAYPAILDNRENEKDEYTVTFPDVAGAVSQGNGIAAALHNAQESLGLMLFDEKELPTASNLDDVKANNEECIVSLVSVDLDEIAKSVKKPVVKKNTTIPADLAKEAEEKNINFSAVLTDALREKLEA